MEWENIPREVMKFFKEIKKTKKSKQVPYTIEVLPYSIIVFEVRIL